ncbi:RNA polymerase sigma factor [Candidatus Pelagibacter sp.]|uniref:RNA polymerase sigma factor n=1 Tax=Candidatus Pelagibacter sp. TaxID=2024849 RepID=UPI003F86897A
MTEKLDENFIKSLVVIALGITRGKSDPYDLVNGAMEYLISNKEKYMDHPNIKAIAVLKMKGLFIDGIRKNQKMTSMTDDEGNDLQIIDEKQNDISDKISLSDECNKVLSAIKTMGEKCQEILMLASEGMSMQEIQEVTQVKSIGTVLSRLSNCRKELKGLLV